MIEEHTASASTLALIREWSMAGARRRGLGRHFASPVDIHAAVAERQGEQSDDLRAASADLMMKRAGEDDWRPLLVGV